MIDITMHGFVMRLLAHGLRAAPSHHDVVQSVSTVDVPGLAGDMIS